ncbi:MAG TPA: peptide chain release factor N(5)-glutamine methyltransferase [Phycisphaerae bacterium]|nr:peptide chain release factor N(5)-glutamine methyltransferase [Phycisphaerae bacterium]
MTDTPRQNETATDTQPWTVKRLLEWTTAFFQERRVEGGRLAAELLLAKAMGCRKIELYTRYDQEPTETQRAEFRELVRSAGKHTPIAYLLGSREFYSLDIEVAPEVLIPRPETEALAQRMIDLCRSKPDRMWRICDVGTGSGCVAVAIAKYARNAEVLATDISPAALEVAGRNVARHGLTERVRLLEADCLKLPADAVPTSGFDVIVSNPPYIPEADWLELPPHIRQHEPQGALTFTGSDGLIMYRRLATEAPAVLRPGGLLLIEIGHNQHRAVQGLFEQAGGWTYVGSHRNTSDPHDRVLEFRHG